MQHIPVLYQEVLEALKPSPGEVFVDGTIGAGGHARGIIQAILPGGRLLGLDRDPAAIETAKIQLEEYKEQIVLIHSSFTRLIPHLNNLNWKTVDGILLDLGLSSMQLDDPDRGFSFQTAGPLDMRFDPSLSLSAADLVNKSSKEELANIIFDYGEERYSRKIADAIIANRPLEGTQELADIIHRTIGKTPSGIHPATRTFQALRIAVNYELEALEAFLPIALDVLKPGGRLAIIAFHSLEDRIVKQFFRRESSDCICPADLPQCVCGHVAQIKEITRRPIRPEESEVKRNPRARSAKLRVIEKL
jgi:16S rRNA (cytosine1402-N4)-methyltransferase